MMENGTACSENDSAVLKLIFKKKKHERYSWLRIKEQWELMGIGLYLIYSACDTVEIWLRMETIQNCHEISLRYFSYWNQGLSIT